MIASIPASAIARWTSPPAASKGKRAAKINGEIDESGPKTSILDGPKTAQPTWHPMDVYKPVTGGSPASSA
jgi:hypothetical protein